MPSTTTIEKIQPWKAHWPAPAKQESGIEYGVQKGEVVVVDGTSAKVSVAKNDGTISAADKQAKWASLSRAGERNTPIAKDVVYSIPVADDVSNAGQAQISDVTIGRLLARCSSSYDCIPV